MDRDAGAFDDLFHSGNVIDVRVGEPNGLESEIFGLDAIEKEVDVFAGVDDDGYASILVSENVAVLLERPIREADDLNLRQRPPVRQRWIPIDRGVRPNISPRRSPPSWRRQRQS